MFARFGDTVPDVSALERAESLVCTRYGLSPSDLVLVREEAGRLPGEPSVMTTVLFWKKENRHRVRVFKPVTALSDTDLPDAWVVGALLDDGGADCC